jgi:hypothetical protein
MNRRASGIAVISTFAASIVMTCSSCAGLRPEPQTVLDSITLTALSPTVLLVSGLTDGNQWQSKVIDLTKGDDPPALTGNAMMTMSDRAVQMSRFGIVQAVQAHTGRIVNLPSQPPLRDPAVVESVGPGKGVWVIGRDKTNDELAIAVSHDAGRNWTLRLLGVADSQMSDFDEPVFATYNGTKAYLLVRMSTARCWPGWPATRPSPTWRAPTAGSSSGSRPVRAARSSRSPTATWRRATASHCPGTRPTGLRRGWTTACPAAEAPRSGPPGGRPWRSRPAASRRTGPRRRVRAGGPAGP